MAAVDPTVLASNPAPPPGAAVASAPVAPPPVAKHSQSAAIGIVAVAAILAVGAGTWYFTHRSDSDPKVVAQAPASPAPAVPRPAAPAPVPAETPKADAAALNISAVGLIDPSDPRYQNDQALLQSDLRADSKSQLVEKALTLLVDRTSLAKNYDVLKDRLLSKSGSFITTVVQEGAPMTGKDGLVSMTTQAVVNVKALQKSLNQMSRDDRIELIRANGDPKISVRIAARDVETPDAPPLPSPVAENLLKERIKSFGFRTWSEDGARADADPKGADFVVQGEVTIKKLSRRLEASGITVTKYALASWTVKCIDRATGEEIYYNTTLPKGLGSWSSEGEAMQAIGARIADELSRDLFLQHVTMTGQRVTLSIEGMPDTVPEDLLSRELLGLPGVIAAVSRATGGLRTYELQLAGSGSTGDLVAAGVLAPLNAKLGQPCFSLGVVAGDKVGAVFDKRCADAAVLNRLETNPPAGLYGAPPARQKTVVKNPEMLRKLTV